MTTFRRVAGPVLLVLVIDGRSAVAQTSMNDGHLWLRLETIASSKEELVMLRGLIVTGFFEGARMAGPFLHLETALAVRNKEWFDGAVALARATDARYFVNINRLQVIDGLTAFYQDFSNRSLPIYAAGIVVLEQIRGSTRSEIEALIIRLKDLQRVAQQAK